MEKCCILYVGQNAVSKTYSIQGSDLPVVLSCRDIEFIVSCDLSQSAHIGLNVHNSAIVHEHACMLNFTVFCVA